jgi:hypothetical protein
MKRNLDSASVTPTFLIVLPLTAFLGLAVLFWLGSTTVIRPVSGRR